MGRQRKSHSASFNAQVAVEAIKGDKTIAELASRHGVHGTMIREWKKQLLENMASVFDRGATSSDADHAALEAQLYEQIGRLKTELDWLKKKVAQFG